MKFLNGEWLVRDGFDVKYAANIYSADVEEKRLTLYAPFQVIRNPGMTLDGGLLTIEVTSPRPDIITTRIINYRQDHSHDPQFTLNRTDPPVKIEE
ncbi:MAG: alpha-xylosidase, partial [Bifidobacterium sp.]|nr:alpha-xylosidase [Bifidobacterium sp.]